MQMRLIIFCEEIRIAVAFIQDRSNQKNVGQFSWKAF